MRGSIERVAVLEDVDVETFGLFAEFCYTRNYRAPPKAKTTEKAKRIGPPKIDSDDELDPGTAGYQTTVIDLATLYCCRCSQRLPLSGAYHHPNRICCTRCADYTQGRRRGLA
jgi:hypothetical protein